MTASQEKIIIIQNEKPSSVFQNPLFMEMLPAFVLAAAYILLSTVYTGTENLAATKTAAAAQPQTQTILIEQHKVGGDGPIITWEGALKLALILAVVYATGSLVYDITNKWGYDFAAAFQASYDTQAQVLNAISKSNDIVIEEVNKANASYVTALFSDLTTFMLNTFSRDLNSVNIPPTSFPENLPPFDPQ